MMTASKLFMSERLLVLYTVRKLGIYFHRATFLGGQSVFLPQLKNKKADAFEIVDNINQEPYSEYS